MYRLAEKTELLQKARRVCSADMKALEKLVKEQFDIGSQISLVGSAKRKLITYNGKNHNFDFDYNMIVFGGMNYNPFKLKHDIQLCFNEIMNRAELKAVDDSTSSLTSKPMAFNNDPTNTYFHIDLAIVTKCDGSFYRLIHNKQKDTMYWNKSGNITEFKKREQIITARFRLELEETYIRKKNLHINEEEFHPSFNCYIEAINEIYYKHYK